MSTGSSCLTCSCSAEYTYYSLQKHSHEWYQTDTQVVLSVFIKNTRTEDVKCEFGKQLVSLIYKKSPNNLSSSSLFSENCFNLVCLSYDIEPALCSWKSLYSKIKLSVLLDHSKNKKSELRLTFCPLLYSI
jgi:suppressor of G2 allele of SKP1